MNFLKGLGGYVIKFFEWLWLKCIKNWWSKLRWNKESKVESEPVPEIAEDESNLLEVIGKVNDGFNWEMDGFKDLFDTYMPATYAYNVTYNANNNDGEKLEGDCDDIHGAIYHLLKQNGYDVALITLATIPVTKSHTMTAIRDVDKNGNVTYRVVNYRVIKGPYTKLEDFIDNYSHPVRYWQLNKFDYEKGKYVNTSYKKDF